MDKGKFQQLKQFVGAELLNYSLNRNDIRYHSDFSDLEFSSEQLDCLKNLSSQIQNCRIQSIVRGGFGDGLEFDLPRLQVNGHSIFNHYRFTCNGPLLNPTSTDAVISYLQHICIRDYPNLLIKMTGRNFPAHHHALLFAMADYERFIALVKADTLDNITNKSEGLDYAFVFTTEDGLQFQTQVCSASSLLISRAFFDSCNRMDYSLPSVLTAIEDNVNFLRALANGEESTYSSFIGIRGIRFKGFKEIEFSKATLRQYQGIENPGIHTQSTIIRHSSDENGEYSGHVLEIFHKTKVVANTSEYNTENSKETNEFQKNILETLQFATVFSSNSTRGPKAIFFELGFPLISPGNANISERNPHEYILLDEEKKEDVIKWFDSLVEKDIKKVSISLNRLKYAIFERNDPVDSIMDAVIAWEGIFSERFETTFKVTGCMTRYLKPPAERKDFLSRLKDLYDLRSSLVHGGSSKLLKQEKIEDIRAEVIRIGLDCIKKLINDKDLLTLSPSDRIRHILIYEKEESLKPILASPITTDCNGAGSD